MGKHVARNVELQRRRGSVIPFKRVAILNEGVSAAGG